MLLDKNSEEFRE